MGELGALFNPGMRHEIEERKAQAARREEEGHGDSGNLRIDLLSGVAVINMGPRTTNNRATEATVEAADRSDDTVDRPVDDPVNRTTEADEPISAETAETVDQADQMDQEKTEDSEVAYAPTETESNVSVSADDEVDPAALDIARSTSNDEPPA